MADVVLDASVWVARIVPADVNHARSREWLSRHVAAGFATVVPALVLPEVAGPVARLTRNERLGRRAAAALRAVPGIRIVPLDRDLAEIAERLAAEARLRGADAVYVALAHRIGLSLVTWDGQQIDRAGDLVSVLTPS